MSISIEDAMKFMLDRIEFKFYAANYYLKSLKDLQARGMSPGDPRSRIEFEMIMENLLFHLVGALDALVVRINQKLQLGINKPTLENVYNELKSSGKQDLLKEPHDLLYDQNDKPLNSGWLYELREFRNSVAHRTILNFGLSVTREDFSIIGVQGGLRAPQDLERSIQLMKDLITNIMNKNSILSTP